MKEVTVTFPVDDEGNLDIYEMYRTLACSAGIEMPNEVRELLDQLWHEYKEAS